MKRAHATIMSVLDQIALPSGFKHFILSKSNGHQSISLLMRKLNHFLRQYLAEFFI